MRLNARELEKVADSFAGDFKRFFFRGLAAFLPTLLTLAIITYVLRFLDQYLGRYANKLLQWLVVQANTISHGEFNPVGSDEAWTWAKTIWPTYHLNWLGFVLALVLIYIFGRFVASFLGRNVWRMTERAFFRLPVVKQIYPYIKQITDFIFNERKFEFSRVVAVEYPRRGIWSMALVTGPGMKTLSVSTDSEMLTCFVPSSPTPFTGYVISVRRDEVVDLPLSIDEALRFTVSGGVIMPTSQQLSEAEVAKALHGKAAQPRKKEIPA